MSKKTTTITFSKVAVEVEDDNTVKVLKFDGDAGVQEYNLTEIAREFSSEDLSRRVNITFKEDTVLEGEEE